MMQQSPSSTATASLADNAQNTHSSLSDKIPRLVPRKRSAAKTKAPQPALETPLLPPPCTCARASNGDGDGNGRETKADWTFHVPRRRILTPRDHELFKSSETYTLLQAFIFRLADSVRRTPASAMASQPAHPAVAGIVGVLDAAEALLARCPPADTGGSRFGNPAFRSFHAAVTREQTAWHAQLGICDARAVAEVSAYLVGSFGSPSRVDYGSGHELNFVCWLLCLYQLGLLRPQPTATTGSEAEVFAQTVLRAFRRYVGVMRAVQRTYYLEPAGSHGVWGLDDYQFLPFLFGAAQLVDHAHVGPRAIHSPLALEEGARDFLYLEQVAFVNSVKTVDGLRWHSPMLDDISAARSWAKIEAGMRRLFVADVLGKLPVMQHFLFGSLIPADERMSDEAALGFEIEGEPDDDGSVVVSKGGWRHKHNPDGWSDCCGIQVPSSIGAMEEMKKRMGDQGLRRVPFD